MQFAPFDYKPLASELAESKYGRDYSAPIAAGADYEIEALLNSVPTANVPQVPIGALSSGELALLLDPAIVQLANGLDVNGRAFPASVTATSGSFGSRSWLPSRAST